VGVKSMQCNQNTSPSHEGNLSGGNLRSFNLYGKGKKCKKYN